MYRDIERVVAAFLWAGVILCVALIVVAVALAGENTMPGERPMQRPGAAAKSFRCLAVGPTTCDPGSVNVFGPDKGFPTFAFSAFGTTVNRYPILSLHSARGSSSAPTAVQSGDIIARAPAPCGYDGTTYCAAFGASDTDIRTVAEGTYTASSHPARLDFYTTPTGTTSSTKVFSIRADGTLEAIKTAAVYNNVATADNSATSMLVTSGPGPITASSNPISNTVTETVFSNGSYNIAANTLTVGRTFRVQAWGQMGSTTTGPQINLRLRWGANGAPVNTDPLLIDLQGTEGISVTAKGWFATFVATCRTTGASGTVDGNGMGVIPNNVALNDNQVSTTTVDTTAAKTLALFAKFGAAVAADTITLEGFTVEWLN